MDYTKPRPTAVLDAEVYRNFTLFVFRDVTARRFRKFAMYNDESLLDCAGIRKIMRNWRVVTFNGNNYDIPILTLALDGATSSEIKDASDRIILDKMKPWEFEREYGLFRPGYFDHIDLIEVAPGDGSLKLYSGRLHSQRMQDLPIEPDKLVTPSEARLLTEYCCNDTDNTTDMFNALRKQIDLRSTFSNRYGMDLRSKSDAQIAEAVIISEIEKRTQRKVYKPDNVERSFKYKPPGFVDFKTQEMRDVLRTICATTFVVRDGKVDLPPEIKKLNVVIGDASYKMGIGGLHSMESSVCWRSNSEYMLRDADVASYYPNLILNSRLSPKHLGDVFLQVYREIVNERLKAKASIKTAHDDTSAAAWYVIAECLKIVANGTFGKLGSRWSKMCAPNLMIQVTVTGQLSLLMLIERLVLAGIRVISANTDGVVAYIPRHLEMTYQQIVFDWEVETGLPLEFKDYQAVYSRDVNNYVAIDLAGNVKRKGVFEKTNLKKTPQNEICSEAIIAHLTSGDDIRDVIEGCDDIRKFLTVRRVNGGALFEGDLLGKAIRWYYTTDHQESIYYKSTGNKVPRTQGAQPAMDMPDCMPDDVDYDWYVREAYGMLEDMGVNAKRDHDPAFRGRPGYTLGRRPDAKTVHTIDLRSGVALCGHKLKGRHDRWIEYPAMPEAEDRRQCAACRRQDI